MAPQQRTHSPAPIQQERRDDVACGGNAQPLQFTTVDWSISMFVLFVNSHVLIMVFWKKKKEYSHNGKLDVYYVQVQVVINLKEVEVVWFLVYAWKLLIKGYKPANI